MLKILALAISLLFIQAMHGQTCCSGGVPVSSNLGFQSTEAGSIQLSLSADFLFLSTLKSENERLDDDQRLRTTQSYIFRAAHSLNQRWTIEAFLPFVRQTRRITSTRGLLDREVTFGIGDPIALLIYDIYDQDLVLRLGAGPQIPFGSYDQIGSRGLVLLEDLQPGSGAWDIILFGSMEYPIPSRPSAIFYFNTLLSRTGSNPNSRGGAQTYRFGNDVQFIAGFGDQFLIANQVLSSGLSVRYRFVNRDQVNQNPIPGTGGKFLFARLSNRFSLPKLNSNLSINIEIPIWSHINETQLVPSFGINFGWYYSISPQKHSFDIIDINTQN